MERVRANIIYASILLTLGYLTWAHFFDRAAVTGICLEGTITKVEIISTGSGIRSSGAPNIDYYAYIKIENGTEIVKKIGSDRRSQTGKRINLREYKSKIRGVIKYQIANCKN